MKAINENDVLKKSIVMMEKKLVQKLFLDSPKKGDQKKDTVGKAEKSNVTNTELHFQYRGNADLVAELSFANKELAFQYEEKEKRAVELTIANIELTFQNKEKEKRASELIIAKRELEFQNKEKEKRAIELIIANKEITFQKLEKSIRESELIVANKKLIYKTQERQIKTAELNIANRDLKKAEDKQRELLKGLEKMMFITSHKVRQPIANIIGFSSMLDHTTSSPAELKQSLACIKEAAIILDTYTRELTKFICELGQKEKNNNEE